MASFAKIDENNQVINHIKIDDADVAANGGEYSAQAEQWVGDTFGGTYKQYSINTYGGVHYTGDNPSADQTKAKRYNAASIGGYYRPDDDAFENIKPYDNWVLDTSDYLWKPPVTKPTGSDVPSNYEVIWSQEQTRWVAFVDNEEIASKYWDTSDSTWKDI